MTERPASTTTIRFGPADGSEVGDREYVLDLDRLELRFRARPVRLRPRALRLLALLLQADGRLVPAEELRLGLWGASHLEWRNGLHRCVRDLRLALADDAQQPRFVATVARLGYRFVGEVMVSHKTEPTKEAGARGVAHSAGWRPTALVSGFGAALLVSLAVLVVCIAAAG